MMRNLLIMLPVLLFLAGCQSSKVVKKSKNEMFAMESQVASARNAFDAGNYAAAQETLQPLCAEQHVNQPLYMCELASAYLLAGEDEKAYQTLLAIHKSIEGFFDEKSEKKAASLWGSESSKVFKGDPYERSTLYFLLALAMLERGDVDNALASLKTGLLADSDTEEQTYNADYGLLQLLAAKCYALREEEEMSQQMLDAAFNSFISIPKTSALFANELLVEYQVRKERNELLIPPSTLLARLVSLSTQEKVEQWMLASTTPEEAAAVAEWAKNTTSNMKPLDYNTLVVVWAGEAPRMARAGEYGERRVIYPGEEDRSTTYSLMLNGFDYDPCGGFGDVNFQAMTRGGRTMDNVLASQAAFKGATDAVGDVGFGVAASSDDSYVMAAGLVIGLVGKGLAAATKAEADIRHWSSLPNEFEILPLSLPPGTYELAIRQWKLAVPLVEQTYQIDVKKESAVSVLHLRPPVVENQVAAWFSAPEDMVSVYSYGRTAPNAVDANLDGEISPSEQHAAYAQLVASFDRDGDGIISPSEDYTLKQQHETIYQNGMIIE